MPDAPFEYQALEKIARRQSAGVWGFTVDGIIAAMALDHHCQLLHKDKDFASMAKHFPLKVVKP